MILNNEKFKDISQTDPSIEKWFSQTPNIYYVFLKDLSNQGSCYINWKQNPAPDGHRCGVCPHYYQKICGFNFQTNATYIFDNHCIMDLYNCMSGTDFVPLSYEHCVYFGNFAYVHGFKEEDNDYGEDFVKVIGAKKNEDYMKKK